MENLSRTLESNMTYIRDQFKNAMDFMTREFKINGLDAALIAMDGLVSKQQISISILNPILSAAILHTNGAAAMQYIEEHVLGTVDQMQLHTFSDVLDRMFNGFAILFVDGCDYAVCFGTQGFDRRSVSEPEKEIMQRGSREGFVEAVLINVSLLRRRLKTPDFKVERVIVGEESHTPVLLCYIQSAADPGILNEVKKRLQSCNLQNVLAAGYLNSYLDRPGIFEGVGITERPDTLCGKMQEGRIGILVDGTPSALIVPHLFVENFQTMDDYANRPFFAAFSRWLKYIAFCLAILLPGLYVGTVSHNPELLPDILLIKVAEAEGQTPLPVVLEMLLLYFMYEFLREAGMRVPKPLSSSISIVGGLVIGETAVSAGLVSAPSLVIIALTVITGYTIPKLYEQMAVLRLVFVAAGGIWGVWGILIGSVVLLFNLCGKTSFKVPFLAPIAPFSGRSMQDVWTRLGWKTLSARKIRVQNMPGAGKGEKHF